MIEEFWGLKAKPFLNMPYIRFFFPPGNFKEALARLLYHVKEVQGEISVITNPKFSQNQFLRNILDGFGEKKIAEPDIITSSD